MIEIVAGEKGTGKTKTLIAKANHEMKATGGKLIYLDMNNKHAGELSTQMRLINVTEYNIYSTDMFLGFLYGIIAQDNELDKIILDNFLSISGVKTMEEADVVIQQLIELSDKFEIDFILGISKNKSELSPDLQKLISIAL